MFLARRMFKRRRENKKAFRTDQVVAQKCYPPTTTAPDGGEPNTTPLDCTDPAEYEGSSTEAPPRHTNNNKNVMMMIVDDNDEADNEYNESDNVVSSESFDDTTGVDDQEEEDESESSSYLRPSAAKRYRVDNTPFPDLSAAVAAELECGNTSDEESVLARDQEFRMHASQDVQVFLGLAARMSLSSLLHLLQGAAHAQNNIAGAGEAMMEYNYLLAGHRKPSAMAKSSTNKNNQGVSITTSPPSTPKVKKFRFAELSEQRVRCVVHEIESYKPYAADLWWSNEEMMMIRYEQIRIVRHFRKHRPAFLQSVETLVRGVESKQVLEEHMRRLTDGDSFARGLETHSVRCISERRKSHIIAVLQEQADCVGSGDTYEVAAECLREQSIAYSALLTAYARRMAQCDHIDALKASMSPWETPDIAMMG